MNTKLSLIARMLVLSVALLCTSQATASHFWNYSDKTIYHDADTLWTTTNVDGVTYVTNGSSAERVPIFQTCGERTWTSQDGSESLTFDMRMKFNGTSNSAYRWLYFNAAPGDTIEVWANSTSSSSARTLTLKAGGYSGATIGTGTAATGSDPSYVKVVYTGKTETEVALVSSGSWYTYAIRIKSNPNFGGGEDLVQDWWFKHGWGDGLDASWSWKKLVPNEDKSLYYRNDIYGGTGCNYADNEYGTGSAWVPLDKITLIDSPKMGDSAQFTFDPATKAITIRKTKDAPQEDVTVKPDPSKNISLAGGRVYLDNSVAQWNDECIYLVVGNDNASQCVRFLPDADGRLVCPMPYTKEDITYIAVIGNSHYSSGAWGPSNLTKAHHYSATYTGKLQSSISDGWEIKLAGADNGSAITINALEGDFTQVFTTTEKNNCYRLDDDLRQITFIFSTARSRFVISPLNVKKVYSYGSISNWEKTNEDYVLAGYSDDCFYITLPYSALEMTGNGGQPEFLFNVYHMNGNSYVTQSWPTLEEGCAEHLVFNSNGWKQIVAFNDDDVADLLKRKEVALYIRPLSDFDLTSRVDQEKISNFRQVPGTQHLYRSYHPYHSSRSQYDTEYERLNWVGKLAAETGIKCDIALSGNLESEDGKTTYTCGGKTYTEQIPDYYREIIKNNRVLYVGTENGHTPSYDYALYFTDSERFAQWVQEIVRFINDDNHPVPFQLHCHLGADRTGVFSGLLGALCGASWDQVAADYNRTSDLQVSEYRHSNQLRYAFSRLTGFDPIILPSGENAAPSTYTENTINEAKANLKSYTGGCSLYTYPAVGTALPTLQQALADHFVKGGFLTQDEIDKCVAKLRGEHTGTGITIVNTTVSTVARKMLKDGQVVIVRGNDTYDVMGRKL